MDDLMLISTGHKNRPKLELDLRQALSYIWVRAACHVLLTRLRR
jgi:hypothetical protein